MSTTHFIKPKEVTIKDIDGNEVQYIISRLPAIVGREVLAKYSGSMIPATGKYDVSEEAMLKLVSYSAKVLEDGTEVALRSKGLVDNHVDSCETLIKLELQILMYNSSVFQNSSQLNLGQLVTGMVSKFLPLITSALKDGSEQSSPASSQPSES